MTGSLQFAEKAWLPKCVAEEKRLPRGRPMECCGAPPFEDTKPPNSAVASFGIIPPRTYGFQPKAPNSSPRPPNTNKTGGPAITAAKLGLRCKMPWRGMSLIWAVGKELSPLARHSLG